MMRFPRPSLVVITVCLSLIAPVRSFAGLRYLPSLRSGRPLGDSIRGGAMCDGASPATSTTAETVCDGSSKFTGVRFSLYPKGGHIKQTIKSAMTGVGDLGLAVLPDDVSTCLVGPESRLFEALRVSFGRCAADGTMVSLQATFSAGCPGETELIEVDRAVPDDMLSTRADNPDGWIEDAFSVEGVRIAAQFSLYPLGSPRHMDIIYQEIARAKQSPAWKPGKTHFCSMLDGDGAEVFSVLRNCFVHAQQECGHVVMTATLTANKRAWLANDKQ